MTIFTSKVTDKKEDASTAPPEVVSEYKLLVDDEKAKVDVLPHVTSSHVALPPASTNGSLAVVIANQHRKRMAKVCIMMITLTLLMVVLLGGILVYKHLVSSPLMYHGMCGVRYRENDVGQNDGDNSDEVYDNMPISLAQNGEFQQEVTINDDEHETIDVPNIGDTRRATVMHDFNQNITAIVDKDQGYCFIVPLNRTLVMPPRDFWDLLIKLKTGYYIPDVELVRENYRALTPPIADLTPYGLNIWKECHSFDTYKLVRDGEPVAISKRSAEWCEFLGKSWCLGDAGSNKMQCIGISGCM